MIRSLLGLAEEGVVKTHCQRTISSALYPASLHRERRGAKLLHDNHLAVSYNCSPSFDWKMHLDDATIATFQRELGAVGYKYQFITLAGFHALNMSMFSLASGYRDEGMAAYSKLQEEEFAAEAHRGYHAVKYQKFVGNGFFDKLMTTIAGGHTSVTALDSSTEEEQFETVMS
jgi:isocitrate lyase